MTIQKLFKSIISLGSFVLLTGSLSSSGMASASEPLFKMAYPIPEMECPFTFVELKEIKLVARTPCGHWVTDSEMRDWIDDHDHCPYCSSALIKGASVNRSTDPEAIKKSIQTYYNTGVNFVALALVAKEEKKKTKHIKIDENLEIKKSRVHCDCNCIVQ